MERMARRVRQSRMMDQRHWHGLLGLLGVGLLAAAVAAAVAGCGSVAASSGGAASSAGATSSVGAAGAGTSATTAATAVGCASVDQANAVNIHRAERLMAPEGTNPLSTTTYHQVAKVRALFGQLCAAVTHPAPAAVLHCPADFGTEYIGTFYDGSRVLAAFTFASSGCERVSVTAADKTQSTMVYGRAAAAAPHLAADLDAIIGGAQKPGLMQPQGVNPGGPNKPA
jgi:hypothetical protein